MSEVEMTYGEKMVYAAALVREWEGLRRGAEMAGRELTGDYERDLMTSAAEHAHYVVEYLREALPGIEDGFGDSDVLASARDMTGGSDG